MSLWGQVKFLTGGIVREPYGYESVQFRYRQYSLDEKRRGAFFVRNYDYPRTIYIVLFLLR